MVSRSPDKARSAELLGETIRRERVALNLTQTQLAQLSGASLNFISQLESGKPSARLDKILDVLSALGLQMTVEIGKGRLQTRGVGE